MVTSRRRAFVMKADPHCAEAALVHQLDRRAAIMHWRKAERARLIAQRLSISTGDRADGADLIAASLDAHLPDLTWRTISVYWPLRGEPDLRGWLSRISHRGARCALPVVDEKNAPLAFRTWRPGEPLIRGFWNIPVPENGTIVTPDIVLAPLVGFDSQNFRLGYGGGYFDRTLASLSRKPHVIGVGYAQAAIETIYPFAHDIQMDVIITERSDPLSRQT